MSVELNLLALRVTDLERAHCFYEKLGLHFVQEQHGKGPSHYSARVGQTVLELYPASGGAPTIATRLGFRVPDVSAIVAAAVAAGGRVLTNAADGPWGVRAVVADPDGHKIELTQQ